MKVNFYITLIALLISSIDLYSHNGNQPDKSGNELEIFMAYDFGEAMFNSFQSLSGEVGLSFADEHLIRFVHMNVWLTESHLKSDFVATVNGDNVEGRMIGFEGFYSLPIIQWRDNNSTIGANFIK